MSLRSATVHFIATITIIACSAWTFAQPDASELRIVLLHVNDVHGQIEGRMVNGKSVGGYARLASAVDDIRKTSGADRVFLLHAGDEFSRGGRLTTITKGAADIAIMNRLGFDFWTLGNGEFYDGIRNLQAQIARATCKVLCANITRKTDGSLIAKPYAIEQVGSAKIAFMGVSFIHVEHPSSRPLKYADPVQTATALLPEVRRQADVVVAITHIGLDKDMKLAAAAPDLDIIIGGHTHLTLPQGFRSPAANGRSVLICQAGAFLNYLGRVDLNLKQVNGKWTIAGASEKLIPLDQDIKQDPAIKALIARLHAATETAAPQPVENP